jgi:lysophospholipase L1-like esterase
MQQGIDRGGSVREWGSRWFLGSNIPTRHFAASTILALAAALSACGGDGSKPAATQDTASANPAPSPSTSSPTTTAPATTPAPDDSQSSTAPTTPSSADEGQGNKPIPIAPATMGGSSDGDNAGKTPPAGAGGSAGQQTPPAMEMPPAMQTPPPAAAFNPCPTDGSACKIMPLGDSITFGIGSNPPAGGYRPELFTQAVSNAKNITFVGFVDSMNTSGGPASNTPDGPTNITVNGKQVAFPRDNEGFSGFTISGGGAGSLASKVDNAIQQTSPNIILLHIGTNNLYQGMAPDLPDQLGNLLDQITKDAPDALLVVAQLTPLSPTQFPQNGVAAYNATIPGLVQERVAAGKHLITVDMSSAFAPQGGASLLVDGIHPKPAGYTIMGDTWYAAIKDFLP